MNFIPSSAEAYVEDNGLLRNLKFDSTYLECLISEYDRYQIDEGQTSFPFQRKLHEVVVGFQRSHVKNM